jgi:hypothetical protein
VLITVFGFHTTNLLCTFMEFSLELEPTSWDVRYHSVSFNGNSGDLLFCGDRVREMLFVHRCLI